MNVTRWGRPCITLRDTVIVMGDDSKQEDIASSVLDQGKGFASRRKVIKGLATTVPVILTITSGEVLANASSLQ